MLLLNWVVNYISEICLLFIKQNKVINGKPITKELKPYRCQRGLFINLLKRAKAVYFSA